MLDVLMFGYVVRDQLTGGQPYIKELRLILERKDFAIRQFYIEKLEVYPSFPMAVGPSWVMQLWWGGLTLGPYVLSWGFLIFTVKGVKVCLHLRNLSRHCPGILRFHHA